MNEDKIVEELKNIKRLLALSLIKDKNQTEQIKFLSDAGFQPKEIAEIINTSANTVRVTKTRIRKSEKDGKKEKKKRAKLS